MSDYKVGDPVTVYRHTRGRDDGDPGEIVKVGRTLVHIRTGRITETFRMDTQVQTGPEYGYSTYFRTPEEVALTSGALPQRASSTSTGFSSLSAPSAR